MENRNRPVNDINRQISRGRNINYKEASLNGNRIIIDPLGYPTPTTIKMRLFLYNLWVQGKDWDDKMDSKDIEAWRAITEETKELSTITVPRYLGCKDPQLICFCDASEKVCLPEDNTRRKK